jgi:heme/copper-type cytochrome/quinol oxidase subunit 2
VLAKSLDRLLDSPALTEESGVLQSTVVDVQSRAESVINYAFMRLLAIALVVPFAVALAIGLYRRTANRRQRPVMQP